MIGDRGIQVTGRQYTAGVALVVGAALLWSMNGALIKTLMQCEEPPSALAIAFYRSLFAGIFFFPFARGKLDTLRAAASSWRPRADAMACVVCYTVMTVCFVVANINTEAANAIILQYTSTFWIFVLSPLLLAESARLRDVWFLLIAIGGVVMIFFEHATTDLFGLTTALISGLTYGLLSMMIRRMRDCNSAAVTVANNLGSAVLILPVILVVGGLGLSTNVALILLFMGVVQFGLPYYLYALGLVRVPAYQAALLTMAEPVLVPVWAYLAVGEEPGWMTVFGGSLILIALVAFALLEQSRRGTRA